jgi:hypothetical protein
MGTRAECAVRPGYGRPLGSSEDDVALNRHSLVPRLFGHSEED